MSSIALQKRRIQPMGGWTRKNPKMALAIFICAILFFLLVDVFHLFRPA